MCVLVRSKFAAAKGPLSLGPTHRESDRTAERGVGTEPDPLRREPELWEPAGESLQGDAPLNTRERRAEAVMDAFAEG